MSWSDRFRSKYGPWAIVTGASDGMGRSFAMELAKLGFNIVIVARSRDKLDELANDLMVQFSISTRVIAADVGDSLQLEAMMHKISALDIGLFVAAAGFGTSGPFRKGILADELNMIDVNCRAVTAMTYHFANRLVGRGKGGIILFGSLVAFQGVPRAANYAGTKAYIQTFVEGLRRELKPEGVDVLSVSPGPVSSGFAARANMQLSGAKPEDIPMAALRALGSKTTVRPGFLAKFLEGSLMPLPRSMRTTIMAIVMGGMTKHQYK